MASIWKDILSMIIIFSTLCRGGSEIPTLEPGDKAPPFTLQSLLGGVVKYGQNSTGHTVYPPLVFLAYTQQSAFLEALLHNRNSLEDLIEHSPENTHYIFMSWDEHSFALAQRFYYRLNKVLRAYHTKRKIALTQERMRKMSCQLPYRSMISSQLRYRRSLDRKKPLLERLRAHWESHIHFITFKIQTFGNWIPRLLSRWYCNDHGCGLDQIAIVDGSDNLILVTKRLDARYDWLPSPQAITAKYHKLPYVSVGDACKPIEANVSESLALVSMEGTECSFFTKVLNCQKKGALGVIVYNYPRAQPVDMNCHGNECATALSIPATMIPHDEGTTMAKRESVYVRYQNTPSDVFFFGIDTDGKVQETGWFLYPSMLFMAYQAQWFNYKDELMKNLSREAKIIHVFNRTVMQGKHGAVATVDLPSIEEMQLYQNIELDLSLSCRGTTDDTCPHWDHTVQLYVCCSGSGKLCDQELGRWITAFRRRIGRWLTPVRPLLPLLTSSHCRFTIKTVPWAMPWVPSLSIRFSDKTRVQKRYSSWREFDKTLIPYKIEPLFRGGTFDKNYNTKYSPIKFTIPSGCTRVKLVATITGHGSDNNNCAEFCVTSHHFVVNVNHTNSKIFKNAGTAMGCAERVREGVVPNEHGTWLYGRDGWCDGQEVLPWVVDITQQVAFGGATNSIRYYGWYNGTDPNPTRDPGNIIVYSYLVYYKYIVVD